jgi:hypothetical protein
VAITEGLSLFNLITHLAVALAWFTVCVLAFFCKRFLGRQQALSKPSLRSSTPPMDSVLKLFIAACGLLALTIMVLAFVAPRST